MNRLLYYYSLLFSGIIIASGILTGFVFQNIVATLLFLPVVIYFTYTFIRQIYLKKPSPKITPHGSFDLVHFLHQKTPTYLITIGLYGFILAVTLIKATLYSMPQAPFISPLPGTP